MDVLFLSHCVPYPPDKGERIRAYHEVQALARQHRVHVVCFAWSDAEAALAAKVRNQCASLHVETLSLPRSFGRAGLRFAFGRSLMVGFYHTASIQRRLEEVMRKRIDAVICYSSVMAQYAPRGVPMLLDMVDVDSEKWLRYADVRRPARLYQTEAGRLRARECAYARQARMTVFATRAEENLFRTFCQDAKTSYIENGVDCSYFDPVAAPAMELSSARSIVFVGAMDYFPNANAARRFAREIFPRLRAQHPGLKFRIVGRNPSRHVLEVRDVPGVEVTGTVPDIRAYIAASDVVVVPLRVARGIQNKVLEGLAMGKPVLISPAVAQTFSGDLPLGVTVCNSEDDYLAEYARCRLAPFTHDPAIRLDAQRRFSWQESMLKFSETLEAAVANPARAWEAPKV